MLCMLPVVICSKKTNVSMIGLFMVQAKRLSFIAACVVALLLAVPSYANADAGLLVDGLVTLFFR